MYRHSTGITRPRDSICGEEWLTKYLSVTLEQVGNTFSNINVYLFTSLLQTYSNHRKMDTASTVAFLVHKYILLTKIDLH